MHDKHLKILILEDSREDAELIERELKQATLNFTSVVVNKKPDFIRALNEFKPDVVLSDHSLPQFNSIEAMKLWRAYEKENNLSIPFILITGSVSEEFAVQTIKSGADDYVLKDRLKRLPSSIQGALEKANTESQKMRHMTELIANETLMKEAEHLANFGSWQVDLLTGKHTWSDGACHIFGYALREVDPNDEKFFRHVHPEDKPFLKIKIEEAIRHLPTVECEYRIINKNKKIKDLYCKILIKRDSKHHAYQLIGFTLDATKHKEQTKSLEAKNQKLMEIAWIQSHEVRAPLARILGLIQLINDYPEEKIDLPDALNQIVNSAKELDNIINKIVRKTEEIS